MSLKLSLCITTYNRPELTMQAFAKVYNDPRIDEIVIVDDCSIDDNIQELSYRVSQLVATHPQLYSKIKPYFNTENIGMSRNKAKALEYAKNDWCILFDSDNVLDVDYLDAFYNIAIEGDALNLFGNITSIEKFIFCPDFAKPEFDYRDYKMGNNGTGMRAGIYGKRECAHEIKNDSFNCLMNTCNYIVHRGNYLATYQYNPYHVASDTIWHNYNHLKAGGIFVVIPGMQYYHRVHKESGFMQNVDYNIKQAEKVRKLISELCS